MPRTRTESVQVQGVKGSALVITDPASCPFNVRKHRLTRFPERIQSEESITLVILRRSVFDEGCAGLRIRGAGSKPLRKRFPAVATGAAGRASRRIASFLVFIHGRTGA